MVLVHLLRLCFKKTNPNLFKNEQHQLQDCRPKSRRSGGWRDPLQNPLMPERSKQLLREEQWGLLPKALGYFIHLFPLTSANQHKLKRVKPVQKNKPWGKTGATRGGGQKSGGGTLPSESVPAVVPGADGECQWMFSKSGLLGKKPNNISDHLSLWIMQFFSIIFWPAALARLCYQ